MLKKFACALAVLSTSVLVAGCNSGAGSVVATTPAPLVTGTSAAITALYGGNDLVNQPIMEYTTNGSTTNPQPSGAAIATQNTNSSGQTTFTGLTPGGYYCWQYQYVVNSTTTATTTYCGDNWAQGIQLGSS